MMRKPIVLVMNDKNIHDHAMIREVSGFIVSSMDEAVSIIETLLTP
jgi:hypothetical protein